MSQYVMFVCCDHLLLFPVFIFVHQHLFHIVFLCISRHDSFLDVVDSIVDGSFGVF